MYFIKLNDICVCLLSVTYNTVPFATLGGAPVQVLVYSCIDSDPIFFRPDIFTIHPRIFTIQLSECMHDLNSEIWLDARAEFCWMRARARAACRRRRPGC